MLQKIMSFLFQAFKKELPNPDPSPQSVEASASQKLLTEFFKLLKNGVAISKGIPLAIPFPVSRRRGHQLPITMFFG